MAESAKKDFDATDCWFEELGLITNGFSKENYIGKFQFGRVYRGVYVNRAVVVKIWEDEGTNYKVLPGDNARRYWEEYQLLNSYGKRGLVTLRGGWCKALQRYGMEAHPSMVESEGWCHYHGRFARVYKLDALDTLYSLIPEDSFTWSHRIKAALGLANFLEFMHIPAPDPPHLPFLICNLDAAHVIIDKDYNPAVYDYSMISGGSSLTDRRNILNQHVKGRYGYIDPNPAYQGSWSEKSDVFAYGVILLGLITKRVYSEHDRLTRSPFIYDWAWAQHDAWNSDIWGFLSSKFSLVHQSLQVDPLFKRGDGVKLTKLAMQCVNFDPHKRPTMRRVVSSLKKMHIVENNEELVGVHRLVDLDDAYEKRAELYDVYGGGGGGGGDDDDDLSGCQGIFMLKKADLTQITGHIIDRIRAFLPNEIIFPCIGCHFSRWLPSIYQEIPGGQIANKDQETHGVLTSGKHGDVRAYSRADLRLFTSDFSEENLIGRFQFGKVYRGKIGKQDVTVKIWEDNKNYLVFEGDNERRLWDELSVLQLPELVAHPYLVKLMGYCFEAECLGIVYNLKPLDTVKNLIQKDALTWLQMIKILLGLGCLLKFLHRDNPPYLPFVVDNVDVGHIMLDEDYNPVLYDLSMLVGGVIPHRSDNGRPFLLGIYGYRDPEISCQREPPHDVFAFGTIILNLTAKKLYTDGDKITVDNEDVYSFGDGSLWEPIFWQWALEAYKSKLVESGHDWSICSLVHQTLEGAPGFYPEDGPELTKLAMDCLLHGPSTRPTMEEAVDRLCGLRVVQDHARALGVKQMLQWS
ncbi:uncharacterized protein LOC116194106 isoform X2 [Punica granatum]|uniref:Uncharacterized protein LOC116194106 isoform X2 n=1 Tax=Punica granatum TaxID=22663 RepID=A0A6P8CCB3_PUNGR|nr:uncharacterized protein LOC116194106 isoform X2 [Punica granatum]